MRRLVLGVLAVALAWPQPALAFTEYSVRAARINFFADRLAVLADGDARVGFPGGFEAHGDSLFVDLRANRYVWAGHVRATMHGERLDAVALALEADSRTVYALTGDELPRVEKYTDFDPHSGEVVSPKDDTFAFPPVRGYRPYIYSTHATIVPKVNIRMNPAYFPTGAGVTVPSPSYLFSYQNNPNFGAQAQPGASFDQPYGLLGTERSLTSAHFRYDSRSGAGVSVSDNVVWGDRAYVAAAIGPLRRSPLSAFLSAYQKLSSRTSQTVTAADQPGSDTLGYSFNQAVNGGTVSLAFNQANSFLAGDLTFKTNAQPIADSGFSYRLRAGYGFDRNHQGLLTSSADPLYYSFLWRTTLGAFFASPLVRGPLGTSVNATADLSRVWYAYPHEKDQITLGSTIGRRVSPQLNLVGKISQTVAGDAYGLRQRLFFPPPAANYRAPDGTLWPGYAAYEGYGSAHSYSLDAYYVSNPRNPTIDARFDFTYTDSFPQFHGYGPPPYSTNLDVRFRPGTTIVVELGRGYVFNFGNQTWSPQWIFSVSTP